MKNNYFFENIINLQLMHIGIILNEKCFCSVMLCRIMIFNMIVIMCRLSESVLCCSW
jgi:hypothetical protein